MVPQQDLKQLQTLITLLTEVDSAIQTFAGGQADAVIHPANAAPTVLRAAQQHLWVVNSRLERMQTAIASGTMLTNLDGVITSVNRVATELLGRASTEVLGSQYADLALGMVDMTGASVPAQAHPTTAVLGTRRAIEDMTMGLTNAEGRVVRWLLVSARPVANGDDVPFEFVTTLVDITSRVLAEQALSEKARQQEAVARLGQMVLSNEAVDRALDDASASTAAAMNVEYCSVLELQPGSHRLLLKAGVGWQPGLVGKATLGVGLESHAGYTLQSNGPVIVNDLRDETRFTVPRFLRDHGVVSAMSVIIAGRDAPYGVMDVHTKQARMFTRDHVNFLQTVANVLAAAIGRSRAEQAAHASLTPILEIEEGMLLLPLVGAVDSRRAARITDQLLREIGRSHARVVVVDVTGVSRMDQDTAKYLLRAVHAPRLLGAAVILTGISTAIARAMVSWHVKLDEIVSACDLRGGIELGRKLLERRQVMSAGTRDQRSALPG